MNRKIRILFQIVVMLLIAFPLSIVLTLLLVPFWSWVESAYGLESIGHSGPAGWCYLAVFLVLVISAQLALWLSRRHLTKDTHGKMQ